MDFLKITTVIFGSNFEFDFSWKMSKNCLRIEFKTLESLVPYFTPYNEHISNRTEKHTKLQCNSFYSDSSCSLVVNTQNRWSIISATTSSLYWCEVGETDWATDSAPHSSIVYLNINVYSLPRVASISSMMFSSSTGRPCSMATSITRR